MDMADQNLTTATRIADEIAEQIISGALPPNAPLRQDHVARQFNSSHVPVREAFRQLEAQHLVVSVPRRGVKVAPLDATSIKEIAEMRAALEVVALRHAAPKMTPAHLTRIELALIEGDNAETLQDFEAANRAFHQALVTPCGLQIRGWCSRPRITPAGGHGPTGITGKFFRRFVHEISNRPAACSPAIFRPSSV
jgi:DNA-binding GntR family transcriptional regulator